MKTKGPSLKRSFNTASVSPKNMRVIEAHHDPHSGATLVCAELPSVYAAQEGLKSGPLYMVGWIPPWRQHMVEGAICRSPAAAKTRFQTQKKRGCPPDHDDFKRDWQRSRVYQWESANTDRKTLTLEFNEMARITGKVARDFKMPPLKLHYIEPRIGADEYSYYFHDEHRIEMRDKRHSALLHELAHAIDYRINGNKTPVHHSPSFLRTLLCLAEIYRGLDVAALEKTLKKAKLKIAPLDDLPALKKTVQFLRQNPF